VLASEAGAEEKWSDGLAGSTSYDTGRMVSEGWEEMDECGDGGVS
jgi:hypothetical protein